MSILPAYADWKAPASDSDILIWPSPDKVIQDARETHRILSALDETTIQGIPIRLLRERLRHDLGFPADRLIVATGHQTELYHAGVWAKLALLQAAKSACDAETILLAVDTDAPKHLHLRWPGASRPITDDPNLATVAWSGLLHAPSREHLEKLAISLEAATAEWPFTSQATGFLGDLRQQSAGDQSLARSVVHAMHDLDTRLGLRHRSVIASPIWMTRSFLVLVHHMLSRADALAGSYNDALREYRTAHHLRTPVRPMPDLLVSDQVIEAPFWLDDLAGKARARAQVKRDGANWKFSIGGDDFQLLPGAEGWSAAERFGEFLQSHQARLSPRALTLTLFTRLLMVDQFVHGIGGGRYDQVTDRVMEQFFQVASPPFAVTTATLYFPTAVGRSRACLPCLLHEGHHLRHDLLGDRKMELVRQIARLPRRSISRHQVFARMRNQLSEVALSHPRIKAWEARLAQTTRTMVEEAPLFDRELFYALQPRDRLENLINRYQGEFTIPTK